MAYTVEQYEGLFAQIQQLRKSNKRWSYALFDSRDAFLAGLEGRMSVAKAAKVGEGQTLSFDDREEDDPGMDADTKAKTKRFAQDVGKGRLVLVGYKAFGDVVLAGACNTKTNTLKVRPLI